MFGRRVSRYLQQGISNQAKLIQYIIHTLEETPKLKDSRQEGLIREDDSLVTRR